MRPRTAFGSLLMKLSHGNRLVSLGTCEMLATKATGTAQNMIRAVMNAITA
jgi:hypothetical protein